MTVINKDRLQFEYEKVNALRNKTRIKILNLLDQNDMTFAEIQLSVKLPQPTVSQHLKKLEKYGFIAYVKQGKKRLYSLHISNIIAFNNGCGIDTHSTELEAENEHFYSKLMSIDKAINNFTEQYKNIIG